MLLASEIIWSTTYFFVPHQFLEPLWVWLIGKACVMKTFYLYSYNISNRRRNGPVCSVHFWYKVAVPKIMWSLWVVTGWTKDCLVITQYRSSSCTCISYYEGKNYRMNFSGRLHPCTSLTLFVAFLTLDEEDWWAKQVFWSKRQKWIISNDPAGNWTPSSPTHSQLLNDKGILAYVI